MVESIQHILSRVRPPRVQITYDVEIGDAVEKKELPFVVGIIADLAAKSNKTQPILKERKFVEIDGDNLNAVMAAIEPRLAFSIAKTLGLVPSDSGEDTGNAEQTSVELFFRSMDDFSPINVVKQFPALNAVYEARVRLNDLTGRLDGNDALDAQLVTLMSDSGVRGSIVTEGKTPEGASPETDKVLEAGNIMATLEEAQKPILRQMIQEFASQVDAAGDVTIKDCYAFIMHRIATLDEEISRQLDEVLHHPDFQKLEGSWRGLCHLVMNTNTSSSLKLRLLQVTWQEFSSDLEKAVGFDQSYMFKKIYEEEYGTFGGQPYSCLVVDFPFGKGFKDMNVLSRFSGVAAAAHAPTLTSPLPSLFNLPSFAEIGSPRDLSKMFDSSELVSWNGFRESPDSRYVSLLMPRVLMRPPYGRNSWAIDDFDYEESVDGESNAMFCWGNPAFVMAERITHAFSMYGWTAAIRGVEGGGLVSNLPAYTFQTARGDVELKTPTEVVITDRREKELSDLGFLALCHCKGTDYAAFFGGQTAQKAKKYNTDEANANALISTRLPYMLNASRFAHYIKSMMRDKIGSFMSREEVENFLQNWLADYVLLSDVGSQETKARYPLREGRVYVKDVPGRPGSYKAVMFLRPHFQLEELTVSLRLVAALPAPAAG